MSDDVHERVMNSFQISIGQLRPVLLARVVQRGQHDVEAFQHVIVEIEAAVAHDVDLDAVENLDAGDLPPKRHDFRTLLRHLLQRQSTARPSAPRKIGNWYVLVPKRLWGGA